MSDWKLVNIGSTHQMTFGVGGERTGMRNAVTHVIGHGARGDAESFRRQKHLVQLLPEAGIRQLFATIKINLPVGKYRQSALGQLGRPASQLGMARNLCLLRGQKRGGESAGISTTQGIEAPQIANRQGMPDTQRAFQGGLLVRREGEGLARKFFTRFLLYAAHGFAQGFENGKAFGRR